MKGGQAWDNNNSVSVPDVPCGGRHGSSGWKMSRCDFHVMESSHHGQSPSNICLLCPEADCNSNGCMENHSQSNSNRQHQLTSNEAVSKSYTAKLSPLLRGTDYKWESQCPTSIYSVSLNQKDLNYDDLSKNIDANLAEIDMETFRSEDIHSILALPVMYSGDFQSATHGEQCASVSGSLLGGLELDSSISPRSTSEDEISICKDEPLFSPVKEHPLPDGTISVDSLDCSSLEDHDLVLTCRANKSNYTIAFEGSGTQFSDDSDYQEALGIAETAVWQEPDGKRRIVSNKPHTGPMVQSDFAFTTWSKLKRSKEVAKVRGRNIPSATSKSQSLPNLLRHSVLSEKLLNQWASGFGSKGCVPLYDVQSSQSAHSRESSCTDSQQSVSLLKLFIQHRMSNSPECGSTSVSSSHSESSATNITGAHDKAGSLSGSYQLEPISSVSDETSQEADKSDLPYENYNTDTSHSPIHSTSDNTINTVIRETAETNNNTINPLPSTDNYNVIHPSVQGLLVAEGYADSEEENSQYFEDSLMDVPPPASKDFFTSPIKEEEEPLETDTSSGDETMKDSKDPFGSDTGSSQESNITKNNKLDGVVQKQDTWVNGMERINNVFPTGKCNMLLANNACTFNKEDKFPIKCLDFGCQNQSQGTQTKQLNSKDCSPVEGMNSRVSAEPSHIQGAKLDILNNVRYSPSRDSSPSSSGYLSSRQGSVERLRHSSQGFINNTNILPNILPSRKINVIITKPCHRSTQIPVHIRDQAIQTSLLDENGIAVSLSIKETNDENSMESSYLLKLPGKSKDGSRKSSLSSDGSGASEKRSIYVCYPNYSLPDLSFLRSFATSPEAPEIVYLAPTKHNVPPVTAALPSHPVQERKRPKSCSDFDALSCQPFSHIKDWESLSVLLPADLKSVISKLQDRGNARPLGDNMPSACAKPERTSTIKSRDNSPVCSCSDKSKAESGLTGGISNPSLQFCKTDDRKPVRGILRKFNSAADDKESASRLPSRCCSMSTVIPRNQDARFKRYSLQEPCQKMLENIPEVNSLMNYLARLKKEGDSEKNDQDDSQGIAQNQGMQAQPCNSNLGAGFKQALLNTNKRDHAHPQVARTMSDECHKRMPSPHRGMNSNGSSINNSPIRQISTPPLVNNTNEKEHPCSCSLLSEIPSVEQLQNQLENLLGSSSNLGLVAAALFAAQDGNSGESTTCCSEDTSAITSCACLKGKKSVKFGAVAANQQGIASPVLSPHKLAKTVSETSEPVRLRAKTEVVKTPDDDGDEMDFPPQEFAVSPSQCSPVTTPSSSQPASTDDLPLSASVLHEELNKRTSLVENLQKSVDVLIAHFAQARDSRRKIEVGSSALSPSLGPKVLAGFCPAMHAILSDGQIPSIPGLLSPLTNSTWRVAEATTKIGRCKREVQELVNHINAEDIFTNIQKFNAFLLGVLNLGCLDWWVGHLCSCESVIKCHYYPTAMLSLLTHQAVNHLKEEFQNMIKPLSSLPFSLELSLVSKDYKSKLSQLSNKEDFHTGSLPSSPARRNYHMSAKDNVSRVQDRNCNLNLIVDKRLKQEVLRNRNSELSMDEFIKRKEEKHNHVSKDAAEENNMLSLFPGVTVYPFNELRVSPELEFAGKEQEVDARLLKDDENISGTEPTSIQNDILDLDGDSELLYSSTDSGCSSQIDHVSPHLPTASQAVRNNNQKEPEGQMFQKLRQKWEQMTSTPEPSDQTLAASKPQPSLPSSRPPIPTRGRTPDAKRTPGKSPSPAQSRMPRPFSGKWNGDNVGHHSRRASPQSSGHRRLLSPAHSQPRLPNAATSSDDAPQPDSPDATPTSPQTVTPKSKASLPPPPTRKSLIPVHRAGGRGGTSGSRSRGTTPIGRDH